MIEDEFKTRELLEDYSTWLMNNGYIDTDWYAEEPTAIDEYIKERMEAK